MECIERGKGGNVDGEYLRGDSRLVSSFGGQRGRRHCGSEGRVEGLYVVRVLGFGDILSDYVMKQ